MHAAASPTVLVLMLLVGFLPIELGMVHVCSRYVARTQSARILSLGIRTFSQK